MNDLDPHLPPLDPEVEELLRFERERPGLGVSRSDKMWAMIAGELTVGAMPSVAHAAPAPVVAHPMASVASAAGKLALVKALPWVAVSLSVASAGGFVAGQKIAGRKLASANGSRVSRSVPGVSPAAPHEVAPAVAPVALPDTLPPTPLPGAALTVELPAAAPPAPLVQAQMIHRRPVVHRPDVAAEAAHPAAVADDLAEEAQMVAGAESALRAGNWPAALAASDAYARRFPTGQLAEEAAYLGVRACEGGGDLEATRARTEELERRFPQSPFAGPLIGPRER